MEGGKRVKIDVDYTRDEEPAQPLPRIVCCHLISKWAAATMISFQHFICFLSFVLPFGSYYIDSLLRGIFVFFYKPLKRVGERENELRVDIFILLLYTSSHDRIERKREISDSRVPDTRAFIGRCQLKEEKMFLK